MWHLASNVKVPSGLGLKSTVAVAVSPWPSLLDAVKSNADALPENEPEPLALPAPLVLPAPLAASGDKKPTPDSASYVRESPTPDCDRAAIEETMLLNVESGARVMGRMPRAEAFDDLDDASREVAEERVGRPATGGTDEGISAVELLATGEDSGTSGRAASRPWGLDRSCPVNPIGSAAGREASSIWSFSSCSVNGRKGRRVRGASRSHESHPPLVRNEMRISQLRSRDHPPINNSASLIRGADRSSRTHVARPSRRGDGCTL
jgi:hypothetical protein